MLWSTRCHYSTQFQDRQNDSDTHNGLVCEKTHNISFPQPSFVQSAGQWVHFLQEWTICNFLSCDIIYLLNTFLNILIKLHVKGSQILSREEIQFVWNCEGIQFCPISDNGKLYKNKKVLFKFSLKPRFGGF